MRKWTGLHYLGIALGLLVVLILSAACSAGRPAPQASATQTVELVASEFLFAPAEITLRAGVPTRLTFINQGKLEHDVVIEGLASSSPGPGAAGSHGMELGHAAPKAGEFVHATAQSGQRASVDFVPKPGTYEFICSITGHREAGMHGTLRVS